MTTFKESIAVGLRNLILFFSFTGCITLVFLIKGATLTNSEPLYSQAYQTFKLKDTSFSVPASYKVINDATVDKDTAIFRHKKYEAGILLAMPPPTFNR